jgi:hypothetical protein
MRKASVRQRLNDINIARALKTLRAEAIDALLYYQVRAWRYPSGFNKTQIGYAYACYRVAKLARSTDFGGFCELDKRLDGALVETLKYMSEFGSGVWRQPFGLCIQNTPLYRSIAGLGILRYKRSYFDSGEQLRVCFDVDVVRYRYLSKLFLRLPRRIGTFRSTFGERLVSTSFVELEFIGANFRTSPRLGI